MPRVARPLPPLVLALLLCGAAPAADEPQLTLSSSRAVIVYGDSVVLAGTVGSGLSGKEVTVLAQPEGSGQHTVATLGTGSTGFSFVVKPRIRTSFVAQADTALSRTVVVGVRPRVTLVGRRGAFVATVVAGHPFIGRPVLLQRLTTRGLWVGIRKAILHRNPLKVKLALSASVTKIRAFVPRFAAEPGYLEGYSKPLAVSRAPRR